MTDDVVTVSGRAVTYTVYGPTDGHQVVFQYGTPGIRWPAPQQVAATIRNGVRLLVVDRPGYGGSTRYPGRSIVDVVEDIGAVADHLGWSRFATWGGSGGAPHALACAAALPHRVSRVASVVGPAPYDADGLDWYAGMSPGNVEEFRSAADGEAGYRPLVERLAREAVAAVVTGGVQVADGYDLPEADRLALLARTTEEGYERRVRAAYAGGVDGLIDDCIAMTRPWDFDLRQIAAPVSVWYGPDDVLSPRAHAEYLLSALPAPERHELAGGHILHDADLDAIYTWLVG